MSNMDTNTSGNREYNRRNNFEVPFRLDLSNLVDGALHPRWLAGVFLRTLLSSGVPRLLSSRTFFFFLKQWNHENNHY